MRLTKKTLETLGGIGSILCGLMCSVIGVMDFRAGQAWKIWVIMTAVLVVNGWAMIRHAKKRPDGDELDRPMHDAVRARP